MMRALCHMKRDWLARAARGLGLLAFTLGLLLCGQARADTCTIAPADVVFPDVSSISATPAYTSSTFQITCTWSDFLGNLLTPNVAVCLYLGGGTNSSSTVTAPRTIGNGAMRANYNLYTDATYAAAKIWGGWSGTSTPTPITFNLTKGGGVGSLVQNITIYGKLEADSTLASLAVGPNNLAFTSNFGAGSGLMQFNFLLNGILNCALGPTVPISFQVRANVINDCNINIGNLAFPTSSLLNAAKRTTSNMAITCSNNTAYRVALSAGSNGASATARMMRNTGSAELVSYQISNTLDGASWGDGSGGTVTVSGTGNGAAQVQTVFGLVPAQSTPSPGTYKDTVMATVSF